MKSAGKARNNGLYRHIRTSKEIIRNLLNDYIQKFRFFCSKNTFSYTLSTKLSISLFIKKDSQYRESFFYVLCGYRIIRFCGHGPESRNAYSATGE